MKTIYSKASGEILASCDAKQLTVADFYIVAGDRTIGLPPDAVVIIDGDHSAHVGKRLVGGKVEDWPVEPTVVPPEVIEARRTEMIGIIRKTCDDRLNALVADYPATEVMTFSKQEAEASLFLRIPSSPTPMLDALSQSRGIPKDVLAKRITDKASAYAQAVGATVGYRQKLEDEIFLADTLDDLGAINIGSGWPA